MGAEELEGAVRVRGTSAVEAERWVAFERFTQGRLERAYRLAALLLHDPVEAQDAVHDAALEAWAAWGDLRDPTRFDAWFDRIVVHRSLDRLRRRRIMQILPRGPAFDQPGDPARDTAERDALRRLLATLPAPHRAVLVLRFVDDLSIPEIAARTGERQGTVKSRLHYALRELRAAYDAAERLNGDRG